MNYQDKDCFATTSYKHGWIHTCFNRSTGEPEVWAQVNGQRYGVRTITGAKRLITRHSKES